MSSLALFLLICIGAVSCATLEFQQVEYIKNSADDDWRSYKTAFNKKYPTAMHEAVRRHNWEKNMQIIRKHNFEASLGKHTYRLGMNEHGDLSIHEFKALMLCPSMNKTRSVGGSMYMPPSNVKLPRYVDWRTKGIVTGVKNQLQCGSCWAFSTTGSVEGQHAKSSGHLVSLSEQNLVDCSGSYGNNGCGGGLMDNAFRYIIGNHGIDTESSYPYEARDGPCRFNPATIGATISHYQDITHGSESQLQYAAATVGPISVAIDASHSSFQLYQGGVYYERACSPTALDHGVLVVGYGNDNGLDYWLVKNSWGPSWGLYGYIKMSRNRNNNCGIASMASFPIV